MNNGARFLIVACSILGGIYPLFGCAYSLTDCSTLTGTAEYDECLASQGNKHKQYELGLAAYEAGDVDTAIKWLEMAAEPIESDNMVYMPPVGGQSYGTVMRLPEQKGMPGHIGAQKLLARIYDEGIGVEKNERKAAHYRNMSLGVEL